MKRARTNIHWSDAIKRGLCIVDTGKSFVAVDGRKRALVNWSSFDARQAQQALAKRAAKGCKR